MKTAAQYSAAGLLGILSWSLVADDTAHREHDTHVHGTARLNIAIDEEYANLMDGSEQAERLMSELRAAWDNAPVVEKLNGQNVRLPGFVVPLDFEAKKITEFLLVPYFGACIHVPPPPANQIVYVKSDEGIEIERLYDAVIIQATMETAAVTSEMGHAGYTLHATDVSSYSVEEETLQ